jgi:hypothetical protein
MLPEDSKARRAQMLEDKLQTNVNDHFKPAPKQDKPEPPYSDEIFNQAAIEWLVETDQVIWPDIYIIDIFLTFSSVYSRFRHLNTQLSRK